MNTSFYRSSDNKYLAGVCGGLAHKMGWDAGLVRIGMVLFVVFASGLPIVAYIAAAILLPAQPTLEN